MPGKMPLCGINLTICIADCLRDGIRIAYQLGKQF